MQQEILLLQAMNWNTSPVTIMGWLKIYMQLNATNCSSTTSTLKQSKAEQIINSSKWTKSFIYPQFSGFDYVRTAQLIDLCSLDIDLANFPYSIVAAAAISHVHNR